MYPIVRSIDTIVYGYLPASALAYMHCGDLSLSSMDEMLGTLGS